MQIFVSRTAYEVDTGMSVESLKAMIENQQFVPARQIRLTSNGKVLEFGTLEANGIEEEDELTMSLEVPCGMRKKWRKKRSKYITWRPSIPLCLILLNLLFRF